MKLCILVSTFWLTTWATVTTAQAQGDFVSIGSSTGHWEALIRDARSEALGGADIAAASGPFAILTTAAPLPGGPRAEASYGWYNYLSVYDMDFAGCVFEHGALRFGAVGAQAKTDTTWAQLPYNPEGDEGYYYNEDEFLLLNAAYDLPPLALGRTTILRWTVGAGWRHHEYRFNDDENSAWDMDLGLSARWSRPVSAGHVQIAGSMLLRNPLDQKMDDGDYEASLPRFRNLGLAATVSQDLFATGREDLKLTVMYARRTNQNYGDDGLFGESRIGIEATLMEVLSLRAGTDNARNYASDGSWGLGLALPSWLSERFIARYDYVHLEQSYDFVPESRDQHEITAGVRF